MFTIEIFTDDKGWRLFEFSYTPKSALNFASIAVKGWQKRNHTDGEERTRILLDGKIWNGEFK